LPGGITDQPPLAGLDTLGNHWQTASYESLVPRAVTGRLPLTSLRRWMITISNDEAHSLGGTSPRLFGKSNMCLKITYVLLPYNTFRRQQQKKRPIILTNNRNNCDPSNSFARLQVPFLFPIPDELLCQMYMMFMRKFTRDIPLKATLNIHAGLYWIRLLNMAMVYHVETLVQMPLVLKQLGNKD
ncbi:hypothetical protein CR513_37396, partial [Mucuna pruriens]